MTTKFLDNKMFAFKILLSWRFPRKQAFWDDFPLRPPRPPLLKSKKNIFIVVSPSLTLVRTFLCDPGSECQMRSLGGWGWNNDAEAWTQNTRSSHTAVAEIESPLVYPYPKNTRNSDHGLSFPSPETQTMV